MKTIFKVFFTVIALFLVSCGNFLEHYPLDSPSDKTFFSSETELNMALTACYTALYTNFDGLPLPLIFEYDSDNGFERNGSDLQKLGQGAYDAKNGIALLLWTEMYKGISKCNNLLQNMYKAKEVVPVDEYNRIKSEARFLRAFYYHYLIELFGDVPLVTEVLNLSNSQLPRTPKSEIVDFIIKELDESAPDLDIKNNPLSGRPTRCAAYALKARVALFNKRWGDAISSSQAVMNLEGSQVNISSDYPGLFAYKGHGDKEIIFSIQYLKGQIMHACYRNFAGRNAKGNANKVPAYQLSDTYECIDGLSIDKSPLFDPKSPYKNRDPRLGYTLVVSGSISLGYQFETHGDSLKCWNYLTVPPTRIGNLDATHAFATFTGLGFRKYANIEDKDGINFCDNDIILMRYAEIPLIYAEAKIETGQIDQSVLNAINKVRQRPGVNMPPINTMDQTKLRYAVRRERRYEFSQEGLRFFDIRRWEMAEEVMNMNLLGRMKKSYPGKAPRIDENGTAHYEGIPIAGAGESSDFKMRLVDTRKFDKNRDYLWPIPYNEMITNEKEVQNPGY